MKKRKPASPIIKSAPEAPAKPAEAALREAHQKLRLHFEQTPMAVIEWDLDFRVTSWNPAAAVIFGYSREEALGQHASFIIPEAYRKHVAHIWQGLVKKSGGERSTNENVRQDGRMIFCEWYNTPLIDERGTFTGAASAVQDITARKQAEAALRKSEEHFRAITDFSPDIISIFDREGRLVFNSAAAVKIHGYQAHELVGRSTFDLIHPDDRRGVENAFGRLLKAQVEVVNVQYRYRNADGSYKWMEAFGRNELANPHISGIIAISRDITGRKRAEAALQQAHDELEQRVLDRTAELSRINSALRRSEERYRAMFASSRDALMTVQPPAWKFTSGNPAAVKMFRAGNEKQFIASAPWELSPKFQPDGRPSRKAAQAAIATAMRQGSHLFEWRHRRLTGGEFPASVLLTRVELEGLTFLQATVRDITEQKQAEEDLKASEAQLHSFVQQTPAAIAMFDRKMNYLAHSRRWRTDFHPGHGDLVGRNHYQINPDLPDHWKTAHRKALAGQTQSCDDELWVQADGSRIWLRWSVSPWLDARGNIGGIMMLAENISARKEAEEALRKSDAQLHSILDNSPAMIFLKDLQGHYLHFNRKLAAVFHLSPKKHVGKRDVDLYPPEQAAVCRANDRTMLQAGVPMDFEEVMIQDDGAHIGIVTKFPLRDAQGKIYAIGGIVTDITERKRTEAHITQLSRVQAILAGIDHAIVHIADRQKLLDEVCRVAVELGGFKLAWVGLAEPDGTVLPVAQAGVVGYLKGIKVVTRDVPRGRGPVGTAIRENRMVVVKDIATEPRMALWRQRARRFGLNYSAAFPLRISDTVAGSIQFYAPQANCFDENELAMLTQVSEEISYALTVMAGQNARQQAEAALRRSEQNLTIFFNRAPIGLVWVSASGTILRANQAHLDQLGYAAKDFLGRSFIKFCGEPAQGIELLRRLAAKETVSDFPMTRRCKDGTLRHVLVDANSIWNEAQLQYSSVFVRDITDRVELERAVLRVSEREHRHIAQDLHDGLGQLLAGTAYLSDTLQKKLAAKSIPETRQAGRILEVINEAIAQTRDLARGLHPVEPEPNGLMAALQALANRTQKLFPVRCHFKCPQPVLILNNPVATNLFRIAQEAITNAIKHGQAGRIEIGLTKTPGQIKLVIRNDGTDLPARPRKKSGMGLRIMRYRADVLGGSLAIQKNTGRGTAIVCTVPLASGVAARNQHPPVTLKQKANKEKHGKT